MPAARWRATSRRHFPEPRKAALAAVVDGKLVDLSYPIDHDAWSVSSPTQPRGLRSFATARALLAAP